MLCSITDTDHDHVERRKGRPVSWNVWVASAGSITVIALCDVFAVLVVPIMQRVFYQHIIQFLIALAIGSLLGIVAQLHYWGGGNSNFEISPDTSKSYC